MRPMLLRRRLQAQALTELALLLPLIALMFVALIELGFLLHAHVQVSSAAREAARAASLYRATRFAAIPENRLLNPDKCNGSIDGWSLQQTIEQAVVRRSLTNDGCPRAQGASGSTIVYSALGRLDPTRAPTNTPLPAPCPTGNMSGWVVGVHSGAPAYTQTSGNPMPPAGGRATVTLCYPHRLIIAAGLFNIGDPVWVNKSVVFEYQQ